MLPEGRRQRALRLPGLGVGKRGVQHDFRRWQGRQSKALADFHRYGRSEPAREGPDGEASRDGCRYHRRPATEKNFRPRNADGVKRAGRDIAHAAGRSKLGKTGRFALTVFELRYREPPEMLRPQHLSVAAVVLPADDRCVEFAAIKGIEQAARVVEAYLDRQARVVGAKPRQDSRHLRSRDMRRYAECKTPAAGGQPGNGALMCSQKAARTVKEDCPLRR